MRVDDKDRDMIQLHARSTDCCVVQAVLGAGCSCAVPRNTAVSVQLKYTYIKHHYEQMGFEKRDSSFNTTPTLFQSSLPRWQHWETHELNNKGTRGSVRGIWVAPVVRFILHKIMNWMTTCRVAAVKLQLDGKLHLKLINGHKTKITVYERH